MEITKFSLQQLNALTYSDYSFYFFSDEASRIRIIAGYGSSPMKASALPFGTQDGFWVQDLGPFGSINPTGWADSEFNSGLGLYILFGLDNFV